MKKTFFLAAIISFLGLNVSICNAQSDDEPELADIQVVFDAFVSFRDAAAVGDTSAIRQSAIFFTTAQVCDFNSLSCMDTTEGSLDGHLVFNVAFADSLAEGRDAYEKSDEISRQSTTRGQYSDGKVHAKTCFVKAGGSTRYTFASRGYQELAVVAEAGGLVTMKVHVTNRAGLDERHDDTTDVKRGRPQRRTAFTLPTDRSNTVELEIINCGTRDCSFVVISN